MLSVETIQGKCEVRKKHDLQLSDATAIFEHIFFCERLYDPSNGSLKQVWLFFPYLVNRIFHPKFSIHSFKIHCTSSSIFNPACTNNFIGPITLQFTLMSSFSLRF